MSICSLRLTKAIPRALKFSSARKRWLTERANLSNFQTTTTSKRLRLASAINRFSSGRESSAPADAFVEIFARELPAASLTELSKLARLHPDILTVI